jgi:hypothetical protein
MDVASYCNQESHSRELSNGAGKLTTIVWLLRATLFKAKYPDNDTQRQAARAHKN